ncbi:hypothetical protein BJ322DRAFT_1020294 [Thelephora terrestris]|uniref:Uncharacterized protein n=1 Tax=Thelephora terrestris TaxID=56493 RepID=A0A9P6HG52_9AGAM|nr:hypothetical protein BJ322DRAFT_1020294 [Thelephora terrestris]
MSFPNNHTYKVANGISTISRIDRHAAARKTYACAAGTHYTTDDQSDQGTIQLANQDREGGWGRKDRNKGNKRNVLRALALLQHQLQPILPEGHTTFHSPHRLQCVT